ncbi:hypothetical protein [Microbacterium sp. W4I20]|uniref:hypothetical protein n=1 Tax=Microbacterium sp. W4I20 TaxID=3042262 RepID=UPI0027D854A9|nr:hypothetical protein [Microbacterium sp. W4I20]
MAAPANADSEESPTVGSITEDAQSELASIPLPTLQEQVSERVTQLIAEGGQVGAVQYAPYVTEPASEVTTMALPSGCGMVVIAYMSPTGSQIVNESLTSCGNKSWTRHVLRQRIVATNPFNGLDTRTLVDETNSSTVRASSRARTVSWSCKNKNQTNMRTYARATVIIGGVTYTADAQDVYGFAPCGW